jgi:hypothetical protein
MLRAHDRIGQADRRPSLGQVGRTGGAAILWLQRQAGNAAVSAALGGAAVQRKLQLTGPAADVATVLKMLQQASGLGLRRDAKSIVTMTGVIGKARSKALATHLMLIVGDSAQTAKVALTRSGDDIFIGKFPEQEKDRTQLVRIDHLLAAEQGVKGAGLASLIHEMMENYEAQAVPTADWDDAFSGPHKTALQAEDATLAELQAGAGAALSGGRLNTYQTLVERTVPGRRTPQQVIERIETHERDYIVYEETKVRGTDRMSVRRVPATVLATFTLAGFTATSNALPSGLKARLQRVADLLDGDPLAGVVLQATTTPDAYARAAFWTARVTNRIRDLMSGDVEATSPRRFGTLVPGRGANEVEIIVRRPDLP